MGSVLFGQRCDHPSDESVINLSDTCIEKLMKTPEEQETIVCRKTDTRVEDDKWMKNLRCRDDTHSREKGLKLPDIERLLNSVKDKIGELEHHNCSTTDLITCLNENERCIMKCEGYINDFIDCIDTARIEAIKRFGKPEEPECEIKSHTTCPPKEINNNDEQ